MSLLVAPLLDERLLHWARLLAQPSWARPLWVAVTHSADYYGLVWILIAVVLALRGGPQGRRVLAALAVVLVVSPLLTDLLKVFFARPRPQPFVPGLVDAANRWAIYSMPSGHTVRSFAAAAVLSWRRPTWAQGLLYLLAALIGLSRVVLGVHWPSDVVVGAGMGLLIGCSARYFLSRPEHEAPRKTAEPA